MNKDGYPGAGTGWYLRSLRREPEIIRRIVTECTSIRPVASDGVYLCPWKPGVELSGKVKWSAVEVSKKKFQYWWEKQSSEKGIRTN